MRSTEGSTSLWGRWNTLRMTPRSSIRLSSRFPHYLAILRTTSWRRSRRSTRKRRRGPCLLKPPRNRSMWIWSSSIRIRLSKNLHRRRTPFITPWTSSLWTSRMNTGRSGMWLRSTASNSHSSSTMLRRPICITSSPIKQKSFTSPATETTLKLKIKPCPS